MKNTSKLYERKVKLRAHYQGRCYRRRGLPEFTAIQNPKLSIECRNSRSAITNEKSSEKARKVGPKRLIISYSYILMPFLWNRSVFSCETFINPFKNHSLALLAFPQPFFLILSRWIYCSPPSNKSTNTLNGLTLFQIRPLPKLLKLAHREINHLQRSHHQNIIKLAVASKQWTNASIVKRSYYSFLSKPPGQFISIGFIFETKNKIRGDFCVSFSHLYAKKLWTFSFCWCFIFMEWKFSSEISMSYDWISLYIINTIFFVKIEFNSLIFVSLNGRSAFYLYERISVPFLFYARFLSSAPDNPFFVPFSLR